MDKVHPDIDKPTSVTHFICPKGPKRNGEPVESHHLLYPIWAAPVCRYCRMTRQQLADRNGLSR